MAVALPPDTFTCAYEPLTDTLRGTWAGPVPAAALPTCYDQLLAVARAHGACRFWLLDMQHRDWHDAAFAQWFGECFAPQASAALGQPLFVACLVRPGQRPQIEAYRMGRLLRQVAACNVFPFYFDKAPDARAWLRHQQVGDLPAAGLPAHPAVPLLQRIHF